MTNLNNNDFDRSVSGNLTLVDFYADWCGPCKMLTPVLEEISREENGCEIFKVNIDDNPEIASKFAVMSIPTLILFKNGSPVEQKVGFHSKSEIINMINKNK